MSEHFADPLHIGIRTTLMLAIFAESVCALLIVLGLGTRWAALIIAIDVGSAFALVHKFHLTGQGSGEIRLSVPDRDGGLVPLRRRRYSVDGRA